MNRKYIISIIIIVIIMTSMGCGLISEIKEIKSSNINYGDNYNTTGIYNKYIVSMVEQILDCLDAKDVEGLENLYYEEVNDDIKSEINRFMEDYSCSQNVLVDCGSYLRESKTIDGVSYERYDGISAIVITDNNAYAINLSFDYNKKQKRYIIERMMIATGKSEAYENMDYYNADYLGFKEQFLYVDYHDEDFDNLSEYSGYEVIFGNIVASKGKSTELTLEQAQDLMNQNITEEMMVEIIGEPRASINWGYKYDYYTLSGDSNNYVLIEIENKDNTIRSCQIVSKKYTGWVEIN